LTWQCEAEDAVSVQANAGAIGFRQSGQKGETTDKLESEKPQAGVPAGLIH
jgi:hypothetical protein